MSTSTPIVSNLDVAIAHKKGARTCAKHPIGKYVSYHKLSKSHRAFTSKISHLFIPRTIHEALDNPDWKLAVLEEMNALKKEWDLGDSQFTEGEEDGRM